MSESLIPKPVLEAAPEYVSYTDIGEDLRQAFAAKNLRASWQRVHQGVVPIRGLHQVTRQMLEQIDPALTAKIVARDPSVEGVDFEGDVVRRSDCTLMVMHLEDRSKIMVDDRNRALMLHEKPQSDMEKMAERLANVEASQAIVGGKPVADGEPVSKKLLGKNPTTKVRGSLRG